MTRPQLDFQCSQSWKNMKPSGDGRHCSACDHLVVDFSGKSNEAILAVIENSSAQHCGHLRAAQLHQPFGDRRDGLISFYQRIASSSRRGAKPVLLTLATLLLFLTGCHRRVTGKISAYDRNVLRKHPHTHKVHLTW